MKRIPRSPEKFEAITLFDTVARRECFGMREQESIEKFAQVISSALEEHRKNPILIFGKRAENMFGYLAASLGECRGVLQEDAGEAYVDDPDIVRPDWRVILKTGVQFLVEVKNYRQEQAIEPFTLSTAYVAKLKRYGALMGVDVKLAVYWVRWNLWTLSSLEVLLLGGDKYELSMQRAMMANEMGTIGDRVLGTTPPLAFRLVADNSKARTVDAEGHVNFTIGAVELYAAGKRLDDSHSKGLAFLLMLYGDWLMLDPEGVFAGAEFAGVEYRCKPEVEEEDQGFSIIAHLSGMVTRRFQELTTTDDGQVEKLGADAEPWSVVARRWDEWKSRDLPLWILTQQPNKSVDKEKEEPTA